MLKTLKSEREKTGTQYAAIEFEDNDLGRQQERMIISCQTGP